MGNYITVQEVRDYQINGQSPITSLILTDAQIESRIKYAEQLIENITGKKFYLYEKTFYFNGTGTEHLFFAPVVSDRLNELISVEDVNENGSTRYTYKLNEDFTPHLGYSLETRSGYSDSIRDRLFGGKGDWPRGQSNIKIRGIWGEPITPEPIKYVAMMLTLEGIVPGSSGLYPHNAQSLEWPDYKITFKSSSGNSSSASNSQTGFEKLDNILASYSDKNISFFRV